MKPKDHHHHAIVVCDACSNAIKEPAPSASIQPSAASVQSPAAKYLGNASVELQCKIPAVSIAERRRRAILMLVRRIPQAEVVAATGFSRRCVSSWAGMVADTMFALKSQAEVL